MATINLREAAARLKAAMPEGYSNVVVRASNYGGHTEVEWRCYHEHNVLGHGGWANTFTEALTNLAGKLPPVDTAQRDESVEVEEPAKENTDGGK